MLEKPFPVELHIPNVQVNCQDFRVGGLEETEALELMTAAKSASFCSPFFSRNIRWISRTGCGWWFGGLVAVSGSLISMRCPHISHVFGLKDQPLKEQLRQPWTEMTIADGMNDHPMDGLGSRNPYSIPTWKAELCGCFFGGYLTHILYGILGKDPVMMRFFWLGEMVRLSNVDVNSFGWRYWDAYHGCSRCPGHLYTPKIDVQANIAIAIRCSCSISSRSIGGWWNTRMTPTCLSLAPSS